MGDYTIDLGNLGQSSAGGRDLFAAIGGSEIETPVRAREVVPSEDEGPEDFTVNLGDWMRGARILRENEWEEEDEGKVDNRGDQPQTDELMMEEEREMWADGSVEDVGCKTGNKSDTLEVEDDPATTNNQGARPTSFGDTSEEEKDNSIIISTTSRTQKHQETADPTESTRFTRVPAYVDAQPKHESADALEQNSPLQAQLDITRSKAEEYRIRIQASEEQRAYMETDLKHMSIELKEVTLQLEQSEQKKLDLQRQWDQEMTRQKACVSNVISLRAKFEPLSQELEGAKFEMEALKKESSVKMAGLADQLRTAQDELAANQESEKQRYVDASELVHLRSKLDQYEQDLLTERQIAENLREDMRLQIEEHQRHVATVSSTTSEVVVLKTELEHSQEQLAETRRVLETVEEENDRFTQQNDRQSREIDVLKSELTTSQRSMQKSAENLHEDKLKIEQLEAVVEKLRKSNKIVVDTAMKDSPGAQDSPYLTPEVEEENLKLADQLDNLSTHYETELASLKQSHEVDIKKFKATILRAADGMRKREARMTASHSEAMEALRQDVATLQSEAQHAAVQNKASTVREKPRRQTSALLDDHPSSELRSAILILTAKLKSAQDTLHTAQNDVRELKAQAERREEDHREWTKDQEAVNRALEERLVEAFEKREKEWRRRMRTVLKERDVMGKALMWGWGRQEVGEREIGGEKGMGYRYREVLKRGQGLSCAVGVS